MIEIELKARIDDPEAVKARVARFARFLRDFDKSDEYWHGADWRLYRGQKGFRVRRDGASSIVNFKTKRSEGGIEVNDEREFEVSDPGRFGEFVKRIGCEPFYRKRKIGSAYDLDGVTIEICEVSHLGFFIEIERLVETDDPASVAMAQGLVKTTLAMAGVPESAIESRPYSAMILGMDGAETR